MALDLTTDHLAFDGLEAVTLDGGAVANALRSREDIIEGDSTEGAYTHRITTFRLPSTPALDLDPPVVGSVLVDGAAVSWVALAVMHPRLGSGWVLTCRELAITADAALHDLITRYPVVVATSEWGSRIASHPAADGAFADIPAKIQPQPAVDQLTAGKDQWKRLFDVYVSVEITTLAKGDLLMDQDMNWYTVLSWRNRERIDELSVIIAEYLD
jgi:hypothetical protein